MDSAATTQRELFSKFMIAYNRVQRETVKVDRSIPSPGKLNEREELKKRPTMTGRARMVRGVVEEQLSEVEGILDHVVCLIDNLDDYGVFDDDYNEFFEHRIEAIHKEMVALIDPHSNDELKFK